MKTKKMMVLMVVFLMGCMVLAGCTKATDETKIKTTIEKYYDAIKKEDINRLGSTLDASFTYNDMDKSEYLAFSGFAFLFADITDVKIVFESVTITGNVAVASCTITTTASVMGVTETNTIQTEFSMTKASGDWLIKGISESESL